MTATTLIITCLYFYFPAACANVGANIGRFIPIFKDLKGPLDFGKSLYGERVIGEHKVVGSFLFGIVFGSCIGFIKYVVFDQYMGSYLLFELSLAENMILYTLMSTFALVGDIVKSVIKRLLRIAPHRAWVPFDEIDHSSMSLLVVSIFFPIPLEVILTTIVLYFFLHLASNIVGYRLKIKSVPY